MIVKCQLIMVATLIPITFGQLQCLTSTYLSCSGGLVKGRDDTIETRLLLSMRFTCPGIIVGWTVAGRRRGGTQYPKLQVWREGSSQRDLYNKQGREIQVDAEGTACETITQTCGQIFQCRLREANQVSVQSGDILGVELPPMTSSSGFELFFISVPNTQDHYIFRRQLLSSSVRIIDEPHHSFHHLDDQLLISLEINQGSPNNSASTSVNHCPTTITMDIMQRPLVNTTTDKIDKSCKFCITSKDFLAGASIGGAITLSLIVISTFLLILLIRTTRKHKGVIAALRPTETSQPERPKKLELQERLLSSNDYENSDVHQISMNMNECYGTPYVYEEL